jgi:hypothetical protein
LKVIREKKKVTYKDKPIKITAYTSMETLKSKGHGMRYSGH